MRAATLVLLLVAGVAQADEPRVIRPHHALLTLPDGVLVRVEGGHWLNDTAALNTARHVVEMEARSERLERDMRTMQVRALGAVVLALGVGYGIGKLR